MCSALSLTNNILVQESQQFETPFVDNFTELIKYVLNESLCKSNLKGKKAFRERRNLNVFDIDTELMKVDTSTFDKHLYML